VCRFLLLSGRKVLGFSDEHTARVYYAIGQGGRNASDNSYNYQSACFSNHEFVRGRSSDALCAPTRHKRGPRNESGGSRL
jgi:hypothetical protein